MEIVVKIASGMILLTYFMAVYYFLWVKQHPIEAKTAQETGKYPLWWYFFMALVVITVVIWIPVLAIYCFIWGWV